MLLNVEFKMIDNGTRTEPTDFEEVFHRVQKLAV